MDIAYLAGGRLHVWSAIGRRSLESRFAESIRERALQIDQRHSWKTQGRGAQFMSGGLLWGAANRGPDGFSILLGGLSRGNQPGELLYIVETRDITGVCLLKDGGADEQRLFHGNDRRLSFLSAEAGGERIACAVRHDSGIASIAIMRAGGGDLTEVTEGDSVDLAPAWVPGAAGELVFQSAGIGRDRDGAFRALGPFGIKRLHLDRGDIDTVVEDARHDFLGPQVAPDGRVHCIRRPYTGGPKHASFGRAFLDFLLFPARFLFAIFQWLNFFTARYTGKPLTTAGGPERQGADIRQMMIWGNLIDAQEAAREGRRRGEDAPDLVPRSWQLVRLSADGAEVLATGVLSFDLCADGSIVYTNGSAIFQLRDGRRERLCVDGGIEQVVVAR